MRAPLVTLALVLLAPFRTPAAPAFEVSGLATPESFIVDPETGAYFISNINGNPTDKDGNGFITKLGPDGKVAALKFIASSPAAPLHAPKGLAIAGKTLFVADIDHVRGYDKHSGKPVHDVDFTPLKAQFLNDLACDAQGAVYVSDTFADFIAKFSAADPKPAIVAQGEKLGNPNGLCVHPKTGRLLVVTWGTGQVLELGSDGALKPAVAGTFKNLDGIDFDAEGNLYFSSFTDCKVYKVGADGKAAVFYEEPGTPADISIDRKKGLLLIPVFKGNAAKAVPLK
jgi:sugar lactone lactonase YvrE